MIVTSQPSLSSILTSRSGENSAKCPIIKRDICDGASSTILPAISRDNPNLLICRWSSRPRKACGMASLRRFGWRLRGFFFDFDWTFVGMTSQSGGSNAPAYDGGKWAKY